MREKYFYLVGIILAICATAFVVMQNLGILSLNGFSFPCVFHNMTGIYCPGCGATRAVKALFQGHFVDCLRYHPFIFYCAFLYLWFMISQSFEKLSKKISPHKKPFVRGLSVKLIYVYLGIVILLGQWLIKNILLIYMCKN